MRLLAKLLICLLMTPRIGVFGAPAASALVKGHQKIAPKIFIINMFLYESKAWLENSTFELNAQNITVPGFSPLFPNAHCDERGEVCQYITGMGEINAAASAQALWTSGLFDLTKTYFLISGIGGISPLKGTTGSIVFARFGVQFGLEYDIDAREIPDNYTTGYVPLGAKFPTDYPTHIYGSEVFELNAVLRDRAAALASEEVLADSITARTYRKRYLYAPANEPPTVLRCDVSTSDLYWHGKLLGESFANYTHLMTNHTGIYCISAQEDNGTIEGLIRGARLGHLEFSRIILSRTASNFDRAPPGEGEATQLFYDNQGGIIPSLQNLVIGGEPIIKEIIRKWHSTYKNGLKAENYVGDILGSLPGLHPKDIGSSNFAVLQL